MPKKQPNTPDSKTSYEHQEEKIALFLLCDFTLFKKSKYRLASECKVVTFYFENIIFAKDID